MVKKKGKKDMGLFYSWTQKERVKFFFNFLKF
jgi:hypothetical protein